MSEPDEAALTPDELRMLEGLLGKLSGHGADLPWPLFRFITEVTATSNVDLLVQDDARGVLLAWRDDPFGSGWHVPGSIIRHREEIGHRIAETAREEFGCVVEVVERPVALVQIFDDRGHSVSLCFRGTLGGAPGKRVVVAGETPDAGDLRWFVESPEEMYPSHLIYRELLGAAGRASLGDGIAIFTQHVGRRDAAQDEAGGSIAADMSLTER